LGTPGVAFHMPSFQLCRSTGRKCQNWHDLVKTPTLKRQLGVDQGRNKVNKRRKIPRSPNQCGGSDSLRKAPNHCGGRRIITGGR